MECIFRNQEDDQEVQNQDHETRPSGLYDNSYEKCWGTE